MATRKTAKKAEELRISNIGDIKQRVGGILELPSGIVIRWRNPGGLRAFMSSGKIPNALMGTVEKALKGGKNAEKQLEDEVMKQLQENPEIVNQMMDLYDAVAIKCFVEPKLYPIPTFDDVVAHNKKHKEDQIEDPEELRYDDRLYVDEIPDDDKAYLFQLLSGGVKDLETFRKQQQIDVDNLARVSGVVGHSVDDPGTDAG